MRLSRTTALIVTLYAAFCIVGGLIGFAKAGSFVSLIVGSLSGVLLFVCSWGLFRNSRWAAIPTLLIALALGIRFTLSYVATPKIMPSLIMVVLSSSVALLTFFVLAEKRRVSKGKVNID